MSSELFSSGLYYSDCLLLYTLWLLVLSFAYETVDFCAKLCVCCKEILLPCCKCDVSIAKTLSLGINSFFSFFKKVLPSVLAMSLCIPWASNYIWGSSCLIWLYCHIVQSEFEALVAKFCGIWCVCVCVVCSSQQQLLCPIHPLFPLIFWFFNCCWFPHVSSIPMVTTVRSSWSTSQCEAKVLSASTPGKLANHENFFTLWVWF